MRSPLAAALSWPWGGAMALRRRLYRAGVLKSAAAGLPVLGVGNISLGGTGKSPLVAWLARAALRGEAHALSPWLPELPAPVAILSRGYGRAGRGWKLVSQGEGPLGDAAECGDEPLMLARQVPGAWVAVCEDRREGARRLRGLGAGSILLDDGFQHLALARDADLLLWDCALDPAREPVLPFGRLRENPAAALDADLLLFSRPDRALLRARLDWFRGLFGTAGRELPPAFAVEAAIARLVDPATGQARAAGAVGRHGVFCGIAAPARFLTQAARLLGEPAWSRCHGDHHRYGAGEIAAMRQAVTQHRLRHLVTTWKDAVRLPEGHGLPLLAAELELSIQPAETYLARHA